MSLLTLHEIEQTGNFSSSNLFQTNVLQAANTGAPWFSNDPSNPVGNPTALAEAALQHFGIETVRFPGGATNAVFADGMMIDGRLPENVVNMLSYARENGISVDIVVPVETPPGMTRADFLTQMSQFAAAVETEFPGVVTAYELGNEYWGKREPLDASLEAEYGANAGETAAALGRGMAEAGYDADVYLQASGNLRGSFGNDSDAANGAIQAGFASIPGAMAALDGVIRNNYWRDVELDGFENDSGAFAEDRGLEFNFTGDLHNWEDWLGRDVLTLVGEYNVNRNIGFGAEAVDLGVHGASYLLEHMTNMIDAGVDMAFAWPIAHNTQNAFIFRDEEITTTTVHGMDIATNTTRAAMLDLMRQTLTSHELIDARWSYGTTASDVEVTLFENTNPGGEAGHGERIAFLSSRSPDPMTFSADLTGFLPNYATVRAVAIHHEAHGDHLRNAVVREVPLHNPQGVPIFEIELQPYEVLQFIFTYETGAPGTQTSTATPTPAPVALDTVHGTSGNDRMWGADSAEHFLGSDGDDTIFARDGDDIVDAGYGDDFVRGGHGDDTLFGGHGDDSLFGDLGDDHLVGGAGSNMLDGGFGHDTLEGGAGFDILYGGNGDDWLDGGAQADNLYGGNGNDALHGGDGFDRLFGENGHDQLFGGEGPDALFGGTGEDTLDGGTGNDRLFGGAGFDLLYGGDGHDELHGGAQADNLHGGDGNDTLDGGFGFDRLFGGAGDDVLDGGSGGDALFGGAGSDIFVFGPRHGRDRIADFSVQQGDRIDLSMVGGVGSIADLNLSDPNGGLARQVGNDVVITTSTDSSITLTGLELSALTVEHFIL